MTDEVSFPRLRARTQRFTLGEPRTFTVCADGDRVLFLRAAAGDDARTGLWVVDAADGVERIIVDPTDDGELTAAERARRERLREGASGVVSYAADDRGCVVAYAAGGRLCVVDVDSPEIRETGSATACFDPRPDPTGSRVAFVDGPALKLVGVDGSDERVVASDAEATVSWGRAEFVAAEEMGRYRGYWWAPDGQSLLVARVDEAPVAQWWIADPAHPDREPTSVRYPAAGSADADVTLWHFGLDGLRREVEWDRTRSPYLGRVHWSTGGAPLLAVVSRDQREIRTLSVDVATGQTAELAVDVDPTWVELFDGVPMWWDGQLVRIADADGVRGLWVGDRRVTPDDMYVRDVSGVHRGGLVFTASKGDPTSVSAYSWEGERVNEIADGAGLHRVVVGGSTVVSVETGMEHFGNRVQVHFDDSRVLLSSLAATPPFEPRVRMLRLGPRELCAGLVLPRDHVGGTKLPVLMDPYGGPHSQRVMAARSAWLEPQWLADQGFAVLVVDNRGMAGRSPAWEREVHLDFAGPVLEDQIDALHAAAELEPDLDLTRVGIRGWSFGGWLAALAVMRRPDVFHVGVAGAPVTDWALYDTFYTERYLGTPADRPAAYEAHSLLSDAESLSRPLLLIHGLADDNVVAAHTLRLSQRLTQAGRPHNVLPLTGVTHMTPQETVAENLLLLQVDFLKRHLT
ncbi:MAG TPA: prolyl oligopeptidase family serine peptidase [Mycobacteriales bacterium]|jgi:dipeptidyl-peptidase-4|nr:prolyl oligopeptidase family serine peptidase [Mycobacteriales bacterium]